MLSLSAWSVIGQCCIYSTMGSCYRRDKYLVQGVNLRDLKSKAVKVVRVDFTPKM